MCKREASARHSGNSNDWAKAAASPQLLPAATFCTAIFCVRERCSGFVLLEEGLRLRGNEVSVDCACTRLQLNEWYYPERSM